MLTSNAKEKWEKWIDNHPQDQMFIDQHNHLKLYLHLTNLCTYKNIEDIGKVIRSNNTDNRGKYFNLQL